ncbi:MAG: RNA pseudouridine synthase [Bacteroidaceae bacterium]|nr:RNA pseudouridine synthase [Bacteroidaceae bacterium]
MEGKMYGVLVVKYRNGLAFLAAYSGQLQGCYHDDWFVPPIVDYLQPESHFMREQAVISELNRQVSGWFRRKSRQQLEQKRHELEQMRDEAVQKAKTAYSEGKARRDIMRQGGLATTEAINESQRQKADIRRAKQLYSTELTALDAAIANDNLDLQRLQAERKSRSEALQQWLFNQFEFLNARGETARLHELFAIQNNSRTNGSIPSGVGECCVPKLLQAAYRLGLKPLCMGEFWMGASSKTEERTHGNWYPACNRKCRPLLGFMLQGLDVEADPAAYYNNVYDGQCPQVLWQDEWFAILDKPAGWLSVQGLSNQPCVQDYARELWPAATGPLVVHRLDQDTSGLMLIAKTSEAHRRAQHLFEHRQVNKTYIAFLERAVTPSEGIISLPLAPDIDQRPRQIVSFEHGLEATTRYQLLDSSNNRTAFYPETGRTHQIRVHASHPQGLNSPIVGDRLYGNLAARLYLHAARLRFRHPFTNSVVDVESQCPF